MKLARLFSSERVSRSAVREDGLFGKGGTVQIAKPGTLREESKSDSSSKRDVLQDRKLPIILIVTAMVGYVLIVWQWL